MPRHIEYIYKTDVKELDKDICWVEREYRTNVLSHYPGGCNIVVEYTNHEIFGYDWIKIPSEYVKAIIENYINRMNREVSQNVNNLISEFVYRVYIRKNEDNEKPYLLVWSQDDKCLPWDNLKDYDIHDYYSDYLIDEIEELGKVELGEGVEIENGQYGLQLKVSQNGQMAWFNIKHVLSDNGYIQPRVNEYILKVMRVKPYSAEVGRWLEEINITHLRPNQNILQAIAQL